MIKVGVTGGIGSGKTTVCRLFEERGIPVYYADDCAKRLMTANVNVKSAIIDLFGQEAYFRNGRLNRKFLSDQIFMHKSLLTKMNAIVHPAVKEDGALWFANQKNTPFALKEAALLIESNSYKDLDKIIVVTCPEETRIQRVIERDKASHDDVVKRIKAQMPESDKIKYADFIIVNDGFKDLTLQIDKVYNQLLAL